MKLTVASLCLLVLCFCGTAGATEALKITQAKPHEGVFFCSTGYIETVLELKGGRYRYWNKSFTNKGAGSTQTGVYTIKGDTITLSTDVFERHWTFRTVNGVLTLWWSKAISTFERNTAMEEDMQNNFSSFKKHGAAFILVATDESAEHIWKPGGILSWASRGIGKIYHLFHK
ncbi:MAG: hypothetical protein ABI615_14090 [Chthoniobacterales bacterium]